MPAPRLDELNVERLVETFTLLDDWEERYDYLLDLAEQAPRLDEADRADENRIPGCLSQVWLKSWVTDDNPPRLRFIADSDSQLVNGLIAILAVIYSGRTPTEALDTDAIGVFKRLGLAANLSPSRRNGLYAMVERILGDARKASAYR